MSAVSILGILVVGAFLLASLIAIKSMTVCCFGFVKYGVI